jgi:tRNA(Ile)-lysidine synthase
LKIPFVSGGEDISRFASENNQSIEEAARNRRYQFLFDTACGGNYDLVCTAHHADDQLETILMNFLRGTGTQGLTGMEVSSCPNPWSDSIALVRPLLSIGKEEIEAYCQEHELAFISDPSNLDPSFFRNRIRHDVIPYLEQYSNGFQKKILQTAEILREEDLILERLTDRSARRVIRELDHSTLEIFREEFNDCSRGIQRRLIRKAFSFIRPDFNQLTFQNVEDAVNFCTSKSSAGQQNWVARLNLISLEDRCLITDWQGRSWLKAYPQLETIDDKILPVPGSVDLGNNWFLKAERTAFERSEKSKLVERSTDFQVFLDQHRIGDELMIRARQAGDRIQPLGMEKGAIKISDLMVNEKIPHQARARWPLVIDRGQIIWVPGMRLADRVRLSDDTERVIRLFLEKR